MENPGSISIIEALNQVQSWLNAGEYDKVIQGCQEILQIEPSNTRALSLMKQAQERRHAETMKQSSPDPLASLEVERPQEQKQVEPVANTNMPDLTLPEEEDESVEKKKLFLAMLVPAIVVVLLGGSAIWWLSDRDREETIDENVNNDNDEEDYNYLEANDERLAALNEMITIIEDYEEENGEYPAADEIEGVMAESDLEEIPVDPRQGEIDKAGKAFGYIYAVYDGIGGDQSVYILSGLFEDDQGFGTPWAKGAPIKNYPDYRDYKEDHVTFIGGSEDDVEIPGKGPDDDEEDDNSEEETSGPKVNPDN